MSLYGHYTGPIFAGKYRIRYRWRAIRTALYALWRAFLGYEIAGYSHADSGFDRISAAGALHNGEHQAIGHNWDDEPCNVCGAKRGEWHTEEPLV